MKAKVLLTILLLGILPCFAQKSFFGLTLGETTFPQAKEILQKQNIPFDENETFLYKNNTRFLLSGYSWNSFHFRFDQYTHIFQMVEFVITNEVDKDSLYKNLREFLLSKYSDYRIISTGLTQDNAHKYFKLVLEGDKLKITLCHQYNRNKYNDTMLSLGYEYLDKLPIPPSDEL